MNHTYSFQDLSFSIEHPDVGTYTANGSGIGSITIDMATERTAHDVAADGTIMVSKIAGRNGTLVLEIQQTSDLNTWFRKWYNYLETAPSSGLDRNHMCNTIKCNGRFLLYCRNITAKTSI